MKRIRHVTIGRDKEGTYVVVDRNDGRDAPEHRHLTVATCDRLDRVLWQNSRKVVEARPMTMPTWIETIHEIIGELRD
jgi:hypothetical protein